MTQLLKLLSDIPDSNDGQWKSQLVKSVNYLLTVEDWHEVGATDEPSFQNGWVNMDGVHESLAYYKDPFNQVHFKGAIKSGTLGHVSVFDLPKGHYIEKDMHFTAIDFTELPAAYIHIDGATGSVHIINGDNRGISFDGISFRV